MIDTPERHKVHKITLPKFLGSVSILLVLILTIPAGAQDYFAPHNILKFADYLYRQGDYSRSAAEYQRYLITVGADDSVFYSAALAYKKARNLTAAETYFSEIPREFRGSPLLSRAYLQMGFLWVVQDARHRIAFFRKVRLAELNPVSTRQALQTIFGVPFLIHYQFARANTYYRLLNTPGFSPQEIPFVRKFKTLAAEGAKIKKKNPWTAGFLSAIVPGLGRFYAGRPGDGLYSMLFIGLSGFSAYRGFSRQGIHSGRGWILGGLTSALYLGNVYGSYLSAKIMNQKRRDDFRTQVILQLDLWHSAHRLDDPVR